MKIRFFCLLNCETFDSLRFSFNFEFPAIGKFTKSFLAQSLRRNFDVILKQPRRERCRGFSLLLTFNIFSLHPHQQRSGWKFSVISLDFELRVLAAILCLVRSKTNWNVFVHKNSIEKRMEIIFVTLGMCVKKWAKQQLHAHTTRCQAEKSNEKSFKWKRSWRKIESWKLFV